MVKQKKKRRWVKWVVLMILAFLIVGGVMFFQRAASIGETYFASLQNSIEVTKGDIRVVVQASGSVSPKEIKTLTVPFDAKVEEIFVETGDFITAGSPLLFLSGEQYEDEIKNLETKLSDTDTQIAGTYVSKSSYISSSVEGRVKEIYIENGQETKTAMDTYTGILLLSMDECMRLEIESDRDIQPGTEVIVTVEEKEIESTVLSVSEGVITVVIPDNRYEIGLEAQLHLKEDGAVIGTGKLLINRPYYVPGPSGKVRNIYADLQERVYVGTDLVRLTEPVYSSSFENLLETREETIRDLEEARSKEKGIEILAEESGIVNEIRVIERQEVREGEELICLQDGEHFDLVVAVDELDIASVEIGQLASVVFSSMPERTYEGEIIKISALGDAQSGVTNFNVTVDILNPEKILSGMTARADILISEKKDVILIPASAISTKDGKKYVQVVPDPQTQTGQTPVEPKEVEVEIGLVNGAEAEIISGLEAGLFIRDETQEMTSVEFMMGGRGGMMN